MLYRKVSIHMIQSIKRNFTMMSVLLIPIGVAINFIGGQINSALKLPLFLDTIGTILNSILCGPWVGIATVIVGKAVGSITSPGYFAFILVSLGIAITVGNFSRKGFFTSIPKTLLAMLITAIVVAIIGSFVRVTFYGGLTGDGSSLIISALLANGKAMIESVFGVVFITNFIDKSLSILISLLIIRALPDRILSAYPYGEIYLDRKKRLKNA